jgi:hypothetical protein
VIINGVIRFPACRQAGKRVSGMPENTGFPSARNDRLEKRGLV